MPETETEARTEADDRRSDRDGKTQAETDAWGEGGEELPMATELPNTVLAHTYDTYLHKNVEASKTPMFSLVDVGRRW